MSSHRVPRIVWTALLAILVSTVAAAAARADHDPAHCLAMAIYWEAKSCGREDMAAVGWVVLNRLAHEEFPDDVCAVVKEGGEQPPCQFSWWCDGKGDQPEEAEEWQRAREVAAELLSSPPPDPTEAALFFHSKDIDTPWTVERQHTAGIGCHLFYN